MTQTRRALLAGAAGLAAATQAHGAARPRADAKAAAATVRDLRAKLMIPAVSVAVAAPGRVLWREAQGMADLELARPVTPESRFRIGSCSKVVTSVIAMRLVEQGKVGLDAPIADYLPDLPEAHRRTTLRQLLGHQGGIRHYGMLDLSQTVPGGPIDVRQYRTTADALAIFIKDPLLAPPGEAVNYSTFGFTLIGAVLEKAAGVGFPELLEREIDAPLGLKFEAERPAKITPERVRPYDPIMGPGDPRTRAVIGVANAPPVNPAYKWPGGGQIARATDLAQFGAALLQPGLLKASSLEELFRPAPARKGPGPVPLGLAWRIDTDAKGRRRFNHAGSIAGGRSGVAIYPDAGIAIALCSNLSETPLDPMPTIAALADAFGA